MEIEDSADATAISYTDKFLDSAIAKIDAKFGDGYAKANPSLVASYLTCCSGNLSTFIQSALAISDMPDFEKMLEEAGPLFSEPEKKRKRR